MPHFVNPNSHRWSLLAISAGDRFLYEEQVETWFFEFSISFTTEFRTAVLLVAWIAAIAVGSLFKKSVIVSYRWRREGNALCHRDCCTWEGFHNHDRDRDAKKETPRVELEPREGRPRVCENTM